MPEHQKVYCMCEAWIARGEAVFDVLMDTFQKNLNQLLPILYLHV